jgi:hypothetical protein
MRLADADLPVWQAVGCSLTDEAEGVCWYLGGTLQTWPGAPLALAVLIEQADPSRVFSIGHNLLSTAIAP